MRTLILSDIHGNLEALEAVLADAGAHDALWNLGDVVGYGASPNEVVARLRPLAAQNVRGNHDKVCSGIASVAGFNPIAAEAVEWTREQLTPDATEWLRELPAGPINLSGVSLVHGSPLDEDFYIVNIRDAWLPLQGSQQPLTFFGHTHLQGGFGWEDGRWFEVQPRHVRAAESSAWTLQLEPGRRYLLNPGSVGQPRDMDWRAAYIILDDVAKSVTFHRVPYDVDLAQGRILLAGLPEKLAKRLKEGR
jgi:diadenosine tetraphosphatase ApaH/serine/threonine PP2A family protein phosphatase